MLWIRAWVSGRGLCRGVWVMGRPGMKTGDRSVPGGGVYCILEVGLRMYRSVRGRVQEGCCTARAPRPHRGNHQSSTSRQPVGLLMVAIITGRVSGYTSSWHRARTVARAPS